ncbi:MAG: hypothetical protein HOP29_06040 [Phycisphaerales bacterium]|nr:hypothetical protein [Phycisphaerales bacterium]
MTKTPPRNSGNERARWQWYHYYFVLASVDLLVIAASLWLTHRTTRSYEIALIKLANTHTRQRWVAHLRLRVMQLNAPGNDVFETRRIAWEKARFDERLIALNTEMRRERNLEIDLSSFRGHLEHMIEQERRIFTLLETSPPGDPSRDGAATIEDASRAMAAMDRHQTDAITALTELEQEFLMRVESLLKDHGARVLSHGAFERVFIAIVGLILIGMLWYGRKLQQLHEQMTLAHQQAAAESLARLAAVGEVCTAVAHGIRNPLAAISSSAQLGLVDHRGNESIRSRLDDIVSECRRLDHRVTRLLGFASNASVAHETLDLRCVVDQAVAEIRNRLEERRIETRISFATEPFVRGDRERMVQCFIELLSNAAEFSPQPGVVTVECVPCPDRPEFVNVLIADAGPGIPPHIADRVFDLFFTTRSGGTGIGLASVKQTVQSHGGQVRIINASTSGARVQLSLPTVDENTARS